MSINTINFINQIIETIKQDKQEGATFSLNQNLELKKLSKNEMLKYGNYIYGKNQEHYKEITLTLIFFIECFQDIQHIFLGKWKDPKTKKIIIEIVNIEKDKEKAIQQAKKYQQKAIYDIRAEGDIYLKYE